MIGIINLEEIIRECLDYKGKPIRLFPCIAGDFYDKSRISLPSIGNAQGEKIDLNLSQPFLALIENPLIDDRNINCPGSIMMIDKEKSSSYMQLFSLFNFYNIGQEFVAKLGSLEELARIIEVDYRKALASFIKDIDLIEIVSHNLGLGLDYDADKKTIHATISSQTSQYYADKMEGSDRLSIKPEFELDIYPLTEQQKQYKFLKAHLVSHAIVLDLLIKRILASLEAKEGFYFCIGLDKSPGFKGKSKALIDYKDSNLFLIKLDSIDESLPHLEDYKIEELIGSGAYKKVYKARGVQLNDSVAIKIINVSLLALQPNIRRAVRAKLDHFHEDLEDAVIKIFQEEARLMLKATSARSHNLPIIFGARYDKKTQNYIIVEELGDETLADVLAREGKLTPERTYDYLKQVINGLKQLHKLGFVHGDLKPENILVNKDGTARITDFGWSSQIPLLSEHYDDPRYLTNLLTSAPELFDGGHATELSDLWSVGVMAYKMMTGEWPFNHEFIGTTEEWNALPLEIKQEHTRKIREQIDNIDSLREIRTKIRELRKPYVKPISFKYDQYGVPGPSEKIETPFGFYDNLFRYTILVNLVEHENIDLDTGRMLLSKEFLRSASWMYLNPDLEIK